MKLNVNLGYDGPVRVWVDGKGSLHRPHGSNPAYPTRAASPSPPMPASTKSWSRWTPTRPPPGAFTSAYNAAMFRKSGEPVMPELLG